MRTKLTVATALAGTVLATCLITGSAQATSLPVLKSDANPGMVTLIGKKGGGGGGGGHGMRGGGGGGGKSAHRGGGGGKSAHRGGGGGGGKYKGKGDGKQYAYKGRGDGHYDHYKRSGRHGNYRRYAYGLPYISYGYGGGCSWLRSQALITGSPYWWNRYYQCRGYYY
jgi:hypothetical protein